MRKNETAKVTGSNTPTEAGTEGSELDALSKGKGKGSGIICHRCEGQGHPERVCAAEPGSQLTVKCN